MPVSKSKRESNDKYNAKCDYISLRPLKPIGERIRQAARDADKSLQGYILDAIDEQIKKDQDGDNVSQGLLTSLDRWLRGHGHSEDEILDCIETISKTK